VVISCGEGGRGVIRGGFARQGSVEYDKTKGLRKGVLEKD
jgi:hypothetical protein